MGNQHCIPQTTTNKKLLIRQTTNDGDNDLGQAQSKVVGLDIILFKVLKKFTNLHYKGQYYDSY